MRRERGNRDFCQHSVGTNLCHVTSASAAKQYTEGTSSPTPAKFQACRAPPSLLHPSVPLYDPSFYHAVEIK